jgi:DNA polymerase-3 subunit chi
VTLTIQFYHLTNMPLQMALSRLVKKIWESGMHVCITADSAQQDVISKALWEQEGAVFLPNCAAEEADAAQHPIVIAAEPTTVNQAEIVVITNGVEYQPTMPAFSKVLMMFDGQNDAALQRARQLWKHYQQQGYSLIYHQQQEGGGWQKMREVQRGDA